MKAEVNQEDGFKQLSTLSEFLKSDSNDLNCMQLPKVSESKWALSNFKVLTESQRQAYAFLDKHRFTILGERGDEFSYRILKGSSFESFYDEANTIFAQLVQEKPELGQYLSALVYRGELYKDPGVNTTIKQDMQFTIIPYVYHNMRTAVKYKNDKKSQIFIEGAEEISGVPRKCAVAAAVLATIKLVAEGKVIEPYNNTETTLRRVVNCILTGLGGTLSRDGLSASRHVKGAPRPRYFARSPSEIIILGR